MCFSIAGFAEYGACKRHSGTCRDVFDQISDALERLPIDRFNIGKTFKPRVRHHA